MTEEQTKPFLWSWSELENALGIFESNHGPKIMRIIIDSRHALEGDLFVAAEYFLSLWYCHRIVSRDRRAAPIKAFDHG